MNGSFKKFLLATLLFACCIVAIYAVILSSPDKSSKKTPAKPAQTTSQKQKAPSKQNQPAAPKPASSNPSNAGAASQPAMADTGPGDVAAVFAGAVLFGYLVHRTYLVRRHA